MFIAAPLLPLWKICIIFSLPAWTLSLLALNHYWFFLALYLPFYRLLLCYYHCNGVSSAKKLSIKAETSMRSLIYTSNKRGSSTGPCGTPHVTVSLSGFLSLTVTDFVRSKTILTPLQIYLEESHNLCYRTPCGDLGRYFYPYLLDLRFGNITKKDIDAVNWACLF